MFISYFVLSVISLLHFYILFCTVCPVSFCPLSRIFCSPCLQEFLPSVSYVFHPRSPSTGLLACERDVIHERRGPKQCKQAHKEAKDRRLDVQCEYAGNPYQHQSFKPHFLFVCPSECGLAESSCLLGCPARLSLCVLVSPPPRPASSSSSPGRGPPAPPRHVPRLHLAK